MTEKIILIAMLITISIGVSGCMFKKNEPSVEEQVKKYMKDKYNEEFKVLGGGTEGWNASETEIYVSSEKFPDERIMIRRGKNSGEMIDNYVSYLMRDKIEEVMKGIVSPIYPKSKVFYNVERSPLAGTDPKMNVDEYIKYAGASLILCVIDADYETNKEKKIEQLRLKFKEKQYITNLTVYYVLDGKLDYVNSSNWRELFNGISAQEWWTLRGAFNIDKSYNFRYSEWRKINE